MSTSRRVSRLRAVALAVLMVGVLGGFLAGALVPAQVATTPSGLGQVKTTVFVNSPASGETAFNTLFALLFFGPAMVSAAVLFGAAEIAGSVRRAGRGRSDRGGLEVGDEL